MLMFFMPIAFILDLKLVKINIIKLIFLTVDTDKEYIILNNGANK